MRCTQLSYRTFFKKCWIVHVVDGLWGLLGGYFGGPGVVGTLLGSLRRFKAGSASRVVPGPFVGIPGASALWHLRLEIFLGGPGSCFGQSLVEPWSSCGLPRRRSIEYQKKATAACSRN